MPKRRWNGTEAAMMAGLKVSLRKEIATHARPPDEELARDD